MKKLAIIFLLLVCFNAVAEEREPWTFSHLRRSSRLVTIYPEFKELLERTQGLINKEEYDAVSQLLHDEISLYNINTRHRDEFEKVLALIHIDAALDYFLRDDRQQGVNKQYIAFYLYSRISKMSQTAKDTYLSQMLRCTEGQHMNCMSLPRSGRLAPRRFSTSIMGKIIGDCHCKPEDSAR